MKQIFKGFKAGMKSFGEHITIIVSTILLSIAYFVGTGLTAIVAKIFRKHFLETKLSKDNETYWSNLHLKKRPKEEYSRQF